MNLFFNPKIGLPVLKNLLIDPRRIERLNSKRIKKYQSAAFNKVLRYAYTVPLYQRKYKKQNVELSDIKNIEDIKKLPFITKQELIENFPDDIIPRNYDKSKAYVVNTSGSSGKPVSIYVDFETLIRPISLIMRQGRNYHFNPRTVKIAHVGSHRSGGFDENYRDEILTKISSFRKADSFLSINAYMPIKELVDKLNDFNPDIIVSYPITLQLLAYFKKKGYADNINPKLLQVGGYSIDEYTQRYIYDVFNCPVVNIYQSVEATSDIAFECLCGTWHINYDFYHVETIDENNQLIESGERGHIVLTRLFGKGTPIIRYTGMNDWVTIVDDYECECGLSTPILKNGVEGKVSARVILPDGRVYPAASFVGAIGNILIDLKTYKVRQFQIIQNRIDEIEINFVIDEDMRDDPPPVDLIFKKIKEAYTELVGPDVNIKIKEEKKIISPPGKPLPLVISKIDINEGLKQLEEKQYQKKK